MTAQMMDIQDNNDEQWVNTKIAELRLRQILEGSKPKGDASHVGFKLNLEAHQWNRYLLLQQKIASMIPDEQNRPTIYLKLRGKNRIGQDPDIAMLGGVGCISDAFAVKGLIEKQAKNSPESLSNLSIDVFSCPPPRNSQGIIKTIKNCVTYFSRISRFLNCYPKNNTVPFCVLSNTAHSNLNFLNFLSKNRFINLVDNIINKFSNKKVGSDVAIKGMLVLGTERAAKEQLYPGKLMEKNIKTHLPSDEPQSKLQGFIDRIKSGEQNVGNELKEFIIDEVRKIREQNPNSDSPSHILLSCTELSLAFGDDKESIKKEISEKCKVKLFEK